MILLYIPNFVWYQQTGGKGGSSPPALYLEGGTEPSSHLYPAKCNVPAKLANQLNLQALSYLLCVSVVLIESIICQVFLSFFWL